MGVFGLADRAPAAFTGLGEDLAAPNRPAPRRSNPAVSRIRGGSELEWSEAGLLAGALFPPSVFGKVRLGLLWSAKPSSLHRRL